MMSEIRLEHVATFCFLSAVVHTFFTRWFANLARRFREGSLMENLLHYLAEVEVVFGLWVIPFLGFMIFSQNLDAAVRYLESVNFTEPVFVFVIMTMAATKPVMHFCETTVGSLARVVPRSMQSSAFFILSLTLGPVLGSFITEPAAMVVVALLLKPLIFTRQASSFLRYSTLAVLLVNISIGGTLTHFAAPPVIMVAQKWNWDFWFMLENFGWKSAIAVCVNTLALYILNMSEIRAKTIPQSHDQARIPFWMFFSHVLFIALVVKYHSSMAFFVPLFLLFLGWTDVTREYQEPLKLREGLLVGFFLGGLVTLGQLQRWWIEPLVSSLGPLHLFVGATALTAITDNAALTYLGTLVPGLSDVSRYVLVAGAVAGGGLTVIANAPNPIALGLLKDAFHEKTVHPFKLLLAAIIPTVVACLAYWYL
jgi:Na+/H+ antiporter NhaD/arsenite permease-like protein